MTGLQGKPDDRSDGLQQIDELAEYELKPRPGAVSARATEDLLSRLRGIAAHSPASARYTVVGEIDHGGMGRVVRVWDNDLERELARKEIALRSEPAAPAESRELHSRMLESFIEEARITSQLDHPGIVPVHEISIDQTGSIFFTMPFVRGKTLARVFELTYEERDDWSLPRALGVILKVCETVAFAHSKKVVHRDLKPANIMVGSYGETYVMDWGLALVQGHVGGDEVVGTPAYMSPEQARLRPEEVGPASDVYSIGAILYELLTKRMPHQDSTFPVAGEGDAELLLGSAPTPVLEIDPEVPVELVAICEKAMATEPASRYPSVESMGEDLRAYLEGRVVRAYESGTFAALRKWRLRNRALSRAIEALVVLSLLSTVVLLKLQSERLAEQKEATERYSHANYASSLRAIELGLRVNEAKDAKERLEEIEPELRGWEWEHLSLRSDTSVARIKTDPKSLMWSVAAHPGGSMFATASGDRAIRLWSTATRESIGSPLLGHAKDITQIAFSPDGALLASGSADMTARLWDMATGKVVETLAAPDHAVIALSFSPDGRFLALGSVTGNVRIWYLRKAEEFALLLGPRFESSDENLSVIPVFAPSWPLLAAAYTDGTINVWNVEMEAVMNKRRFPDGLTAIAYAPDGQRIAIGTVKGTAAILDPASLETVHELEGHSGIINSVRFSPDGGLLLTASSDSTIRVWDAETGEQTNTLIGHDGRVRSVDFSPDGALVLSASEDCTARVWKRDSEAIVVLRHDDWVTTLSADPAAPVLASGSRDSSIRLWDARDGRLLESREVADIVDCVAHHPVEPLLAYAASDPVIHLMDAASGDSLGELTGHPNPVLSLAFSPDGRHLLSRSLHETVLWDVESTDDLVSLVRPESWTTAIAYHPEGDLFATGYQDGLVRLYEAESTTPVAELDNGAEITAIAFHPGGHLMACGKYGNEIVLWTRGSDDTWSRSTPLEGHADLIHSLAFSPDGARLVSGSSDRTVRVWDLEKERLLLTLRGHEEDVVSVAFSSDGRAIFSASWDRTIRIWQTRADPAAER